MTKRWLQKAAVYRRFAKAAEDTGFVCDWSDAAAEDMFRFESNGGTPPARDNGYAIGKGWLDVQIASWVEDALHFPPLVLWGEIDADLQGQVKRAAMSAALRAP